MQESTAGSASAKKPCYYRVCYRDSHGASAVALIQGIEAAHQGG
jgi:hypothetical protein